MTLSEGIDGYLAYKRELGAKLITEESILRSFLKIAGNLPLDQEMESEVFNFLNHRPGSAASWGSKCRLLMSFFTYWSMRDQARPLKIPRPRTMVASSRVPYVYSEKQISSLLEATTKCQRRGSCKLPAESLRILLLLLYCTGMTIREVIQLEADAFAPSLGTLRIHSSRYDNDRTIPCAQIYARRLSDTKAGKAP